jgi:large subunit ribosomal protein L3
LRVVKVDAEENLLLVCGAVPGPQGSYIMIRKSRKTKKNSAPAK